MTLVRTLCSCESCDRISSPTFSGFWRFRESRPCDASIYRRTDKQWMMFMVVVIAWLIADYSKCARRISIRLVHFVVAEQSNGLDVGNTEFRVYPKCCVCVMRMLIYLKTALRFCAKLVSFFYWRFFFFDKQEFIYRFVNRIEEIFCC